MPGTRHSVGMEVLGQIARRLGVAEKWARDSRCAADLALAPFGDAQLVLLRPRRLMNVNGRSVAQAGELWVSWIRGHQDQRGFKCLVSPSYYCEGLGSLFIYMGVVVVPLSRCAVTRVLFPCAKRSCLG